MRAFRVAALVLLLIPADVLGQGWVGQGRVHRANATPDGQPTIPTLCSDHPHVVWFANRGDTSLAHAQWLGDRWSNDRPFGPDTAPIAFRVRPSVALDEDGNLWLVWDCAYTTNTNDIGSARWMDSIWLAEVQVNVPDSTEQDFAPKVACRGGQVWCVWYGGPTDMSPYSVFASRWNDEEQCWEPEMRVSPDDGRHHWWCDVAVDAEGTPHVVWCTHPLYTVFYSYFEDSVWQGPFPVNDTTQVTASPWADPHIVCDQEGVLHLSFTGARAGASHRDIFYAFNDGTGWSECEMVTRDSLYDEWYADVAADRPDNVWLGWDRQGEGTDEFRVYASHFDGVEWSPEERLDNDSAYRDAGLALGLDSLGWPWVVWSGKSHSTENGDVFYNRWSAVGLERPVGFKVGQARASVDCASPFSPGGAIAFGLPYAGSASIEVLDMCGRLLRQLECGHRTSGEHRIRWDGRDKQGRRVPAGAYLLRLLSGPETASHKVTVLSW